MSVKTGFNIVKINTNVTNIDRFMFKRAIEAWYREYRPAWYVTVTNVKHMGSNYDPKDEDIIQTFSVEWEEPNEP